jgi:hypothetical protein
MEIVNMLDWDDEDAAEYYRKEGKAEGIAIGEAKGKEKLVQTAMAMLDKGMSLDLVSN